MKIHPTAIVEDGASLADDVEIGPYCVVGPSAVIASGVKLLSHVVVRNRTEIGAGTLVYPHVVLGGEAQMRRVNRNDIRLCIGRDNIIREGVTVSVGSEVGRGTTAIGDGCYLMAASHVGHDCDIGSGVTLSNGAQLGGHVTIGEGAILGGLAAVQQFSRIGRYAFISGLSGVSTDVIPYGMAIGLHVRLGGLNLIGLRRRNIPRANMHALRAAYRAIFLDEAGSLHDRARAFAGRCAGVPEVDEIIAFILADAKRPICPARRRGANADED